MHHAGRTLLYSQMLKQKEQLLFDWLLYIVLAHLQTVTKSLVNKSKIKPILIVSSLY